METIWSPRNLGWAAGLLLVVAMTVLTARPAMAQDSPVRVSVVVTWDMGLRVGVEYRPFERVGFAAHVGSSLFSLEQDPETGRRSFLLTWDALALYYALPRSSPLQLNVCVGIPDGRMVFISPPAGEVSLGISSHVGYRVAEGVELFLRAGAGLPFFWGEGEPLHYDPTSFLLGLWPDLSLGGRFRL